MTRTFNQMFDECNVRYFRGRLPKYTVRVRAQLRGGDGHTGQCDQATRTIWLVRQSDNTMRRCLLHEMCHHGTPGHGLRFQAKLTRLAEMGEDWATEECRQYQEARDLEGPSLTAAMKYTLGDIAWDYPTLSWIAVRQMLAREYCRSVTELRRTFPWAQASWKRLVAERQQVDKQQQRLKRRIAHETDTASH